MKNLTSEIHRARLRHLRDPAVLRGQAWPRRRRAGPSRGRSGHDDGVEHGARRNPGSPDAPGSGPVEQPAQSRKGHPGLSESNKRAGEEWGGQGGGGVVRRGLRLAQ